MNKTIVTGIRATGIPHIGNYVGSIKPIIEYQDTYDIFQVVADIHSIMNVRDPIVLSNNVRSITACYLACGLDTEKSVLWRQSHADEMTSIATMLFSLATTKELNLLLDKNGVSSDSVDIVTYLYPILMAADMLLINPDYLFAGVDHVGGFKFIQELVVRFNSTYGETLKRPELLFSDIKELVRGLDGRKMSKSFGNTITILEPKDRLYELITQSHFNKVEDSKEQINSLFKLLSYFTTESQYKDVEQIFLSGDMDIKKVREIVFEYVNDELEPIRNKYNEIILQSDYIDSVLEKGLEKVKKHSVVTVEDMYNKVGFSR